jgi:hypothetical protein
MKIPLLADPKLIYKAVQQIQVILGEELTFLTKSFGICETRERQDKTIATVYQGESLDEYEVNPKDDIKAFCFWDKLDPIETTYADNQGPSKSKYSNLKYNVALIFYTSNIKKLNLSVDVRQSKTIIMQEFLKVLQRGLLTAQSDLVITNIFDEDITEIYKGYTVNAMKQPEYAIRFECDISFNESCYQ